MGDNWKTIAFTYVAVASLFLARNTYRWLRWERHWPGARLWTLPFRSAFWAVAWIGLDWSPVRAAWRSLKSVYHRARAFPPPLTKSNAEYVCEVATEDAADVDHRRFIVDAADAFSAKNAEGIPRIGWIDKGGRFEGHRVVRIESRPWGASKSRFDVRVLYEKPQPKKPDIRVSAATQAFMAGIMTAKEAVDRFNAWIATSGYIDFGSPHGSFTVGQVSGICAKSHTDAIDVVRAMPGFENSVKHSSRLDTNTGTYSVEFRFSDDAANRRKPSPYDFVEERFWPALKGPAAKCEKCGAPATNTAVDAFKSAWDDGFWKYSPGNVIHFGCDEHPAESKVYQT